MPEINRRQAMVPDGADVIPNGFGTAPGLWLEFEGRVLLLLPGPPAELKPMVERVVAERLARWPVAAACSGASFVSAGARNPKSTSWRRRCIRAG